VDSIETSKTHKLYLLLKERIMSGALAPGHRLPSEPRLAETHRLSRVTIRRALDGLARDGLIVRQPGAGTFVREAISPPAVVADLSNMLGHLVAMGKSTRARLLSFNYVDAPEPVAAALRLEGGERVQHSLRIRFIDDAPFSYLSTYVPERIGVSYSEADLARRPLLELLEQSGVAADRAEQTISATLAGPEAGAALGVVIGAPLIALTRTVLGKDGRGIEYLSALYRPDRYQFHMDLRRTGEANDRHWRPVETSLGTVSSRRGLGKRRRP
jgi:GntR family transcriptional regulator